MKKLKEIRDNLLNSLNTAIGGYSARKLTAFVTVICILYIHYKYIGSANAIDALFYDMMFVLVLLGIVTFEQLYRLKTEVGKKIDLPKAPDINLSGSTDINVVEVIKDQM
jgi:hypothetical protein